MNGYNFTSAVRQVLAVSREEAARLHHEYVGTEHMLLGMTRVDDTMAHAILDAHGVDRAEITSLIETTVRSGRPAEIIGADLPYTTRAKVVLEKSMRAADDLDEHFVGTQHLLLGMVREKHGIAAQVLAHLGVTKDSALQTAKAVRATGQTET